MSKRRSKLTEDEVKNLFTFLSSQIVLNGCDHTLRFTKQWLNEHMGANAKSCLTYIEKQGGFCDCEVLMNTYREYDIELNGED